MRIARSGGDRLLGDARARLVDHIRETDRDPAFLDRAQRRRDGGDRDVAVVRGELVRLTAGAALREHVELGTEHVALGYLERLALAVAGLAALHIECRALVDEMGRIPGAEV